MEIDYLESIHIFLFGPLLDPDPEVDLLFVNTGNPPPPAYVVLGSFLILFWLIPWVLVFEVGVLSLTPIVPLIGFFTPGGVVYSILRFKPAIRLSV